ncbi:zinc ribbon domain-containing protein [Actinoplanes sp. NPDC051861]|uniref:zinc ribbon domain-containing protein n=1 Tax=Actinoplanes sp. NPDC051861 TaxID=3155170 RepID=UPI0034323359
MTSKLACPFCYHPIKRRSDLWFLCRGRPAGNRPACRRQVDPVRLNQTGFTEATLPAFPPSAELSLLPTSKANCPYCGGETQSRACPECHTKLPMEFGVSASPLISMLGARGTGKTVFLTVLSDELQQERIRKEFGATVQPIGSGQEGFTSQAKAVRERIHQVYVEGQLFDTSPQARDGRKEPMVLEWRNERPTGNRLGLRRQRTHYLSFFDTAGEDLAHDADTHSLHYLRASNYLILLLDPFQLPEVQQMLNLPEAAILNREPTRDVLTRITETLKDSAHWNGRQITVPVAVAFTKMDGFFARHLDDSHPLRRAERRPGGYDEVHGRLIHEQMAALLEDWGGGDINSQLRAWYRDYQYFFVSALGEQPNYESATTRERPRPVRVEEPLLWLMSKGGLVAKVTP